VKAYFLEVFMDNDAFFSPSPFSSEYSLSLLKVFIISSSSSSSLFAISFAFATNLSIRLLFFDASIDEMLFLNSSPFLFSSS